VALSSGTVGGLGGQLFRKLILLRVKDRVPVTQQVMTTTTMAWCQCYKTFFLFIDRENEKAKAFVPLKLFQPWTDVMKLLWP